MQTRDLAWVASGPGAPGHPAGRAPPGPGPGRAAAPGGGGGDPQRGDDRLLVVTGPCSIHDCEAALDYAGRLARVAGAVAGELCVVMRVYFEKPRTTGLEGPGQRSPPGQQLRRQRRAAPGPAPLAGRGGPGPPGGMRVPRSHLPPVLRRRRLLGAIGARTTESQVHRQLASGLSCPVGFKNGTDGRVQTAVDAVRAGAYPHSFLGSPSRAWLDRDHRATRTATSSCAEATAVLTTTRRAWDRPWRPCAGPASRPVW